MFRLRNLKQNYTSFGNVVADTIFVDVVVLTGNISGINTESIRKALHHTPLLLVQGTCRTELAPVFWVSSVVGAKMKGLLGG